MNAILIDTQVTRDALRAAFLFLRPIAERFIETILDGIIQDRPNPDSLLIEFVRALARATARQDHRMAQEQAKPAGDKGNAR